MTHKQASNFEDPRQVCILWHPADRSPAEGLIGALSKRGFSIIPSQSTHTVFGAACRYSKSADRVVVVFDGLDLLDDADRILDGLERFAPGVICWQHEPGANPPMVPIVRTMSAGVSTSPVDAVQSPCADSDSDPSPATNELRFVPDKDAQALGRPSISLPKTGSMSGALSSSDVLDADELDALLAGEMDENRGKHE